LNQLFIKLNTMVLFIVGNIFFKTTFVTVITKLSKEERKKEEENCLE